MEYLWLCLAATLAGAVNAIAGGGTLLTFPVLRALVPPVMANGTSTLALMPGSLASAWGYRDQMHDCRRWLRILIIPSLLGGATGTALVTLMPERVFEVLIPWLILGAALLFLMQPALSALLKEHQKDAAPRGGRLVAIVIAQFFIAVYGGYFGAGIGILMLSSLSFLGLKSIHEVNALKTYLALCMNGTSAILFLASGNVVYPYALAMAIAAIVGGYVGARLSLRLRPAVVRWIVIVIGFGLAAYEFHALALSQQDADSTEIR